jgi:acyl-CoA thioesterase-1
MKLIYKIFIIIAVIIIIVAIYFFLRGPQQTNNNLQEKVFTQDNTEIKIIAFGDSLTAGYNLLSYESYPAQLESRLTEAGFSVKIINSGVSGETTRGNLERANFIRSQNPDIVLLGIGGNDALRSLSVADVKSNIEKTIQILQSGENPPQVFLLQMQAPLNSGFAYKRQFDAVYPTLAKIYEIELVPFLTVEIFLDSSNVLSDGIHLNKQGYRKVVNQHIFPALTKELSR